MSHTRLNLPHPMGMLEWLRNVCSPPHLNFVGFAKKNVQVCKL